MSILKEAELKESETNKCAFVESKKLLVIESELCTKLENLEFTSPIEYIYNPLKYARDLHEKFIQKYFEKSTKKILFLGMNPGPWGMCQTGIAFGERNHVKEWFQITGSVQKPDKEHPKRKVVGLDCHRSEISGKRFWGLFRTLCGSPENFFKHSFVYNLCPLSFLNAAGNNITPPEIKNKNTKKLLNEICDEAFISIIREFNFEIVIGIGNFAKKRAKKALESYKINIKVFSIPHPSARSGMNASKWKQETLRILQDEDVIKYFNENQPKNARK